MFAKKTFLNTKAKLARKNARFTRSLVLISKLERKILPNEKRFEKCLFSGYPLRGYRSIISN